MREKCALLGKTGCVTFLVAWVFYDSWAGILSVALVFPLFLWEYRDASAQKFKYELEKQFCEGLFFAAGALEAGYSAENAWRQMQCEVERLFGKGSFYGCALADMNQRVAINQPLERLMLDFSQKTDSDLIKTFAEVFYFARKSGGNLAAIMRQTASRIRQNFQIQEEVQLAIASRKLELAIMNVLPFSILGYLKICSKEFLEPLYHTPVGICVMTICLAMYLMAWIIAKRMMKIGA